jgi:uncharacterized repeat protein (TIGR03803 family)
LDTTGKETVLHTFSKPSDGLFPSDVPLNASGVLYGTASGGGNKCASNGGCGVIYKLEKTGSYSVLYRFKSGKFGNDPGALLRDPVGNLYGATRLGGGKGCSGGGCGVIFKFTP